PEAGGEGARICCLCELTKMRNKERAYAPSPPALREGSHWDERGAGVRGLRAREQQAHLLPDRRPGSSLPAQSLNGRHDFIDLVINLRVPKPQHGPPILGQELRPRRIDFETSFVNIAVHFNNDLTLDAGEVREEWSDRRLPPEFEFAQAPSAQPAPEDSFRRRGVFPQLAGAVSWA